MLGALPALCFKAVCKARVKYECLQKAYLTLHAHLPGHRAENLPVVVPGNSVRVCRHGLANLSTATRWRDTNPRRGRPPRDKRLCLTGSDLVNMACPSLKTWAWSCTRPLQLLLTPCRTADNFLSAWGLGVYKSSPSSTPDLLPRAALGLPLTQPSQRRPSAQPVRPRPALALHQHQPVVALLPLPSLQPAPAPAILCLICRAVRGLLVHRHRLCTMDRWSARTCISYFGPACSAGLVVFGS